MSHMLKDIAVFYDTSGFGKRVLKTAARLASEQSARLVGITTSNKASDTIPEDSFARGEAIGEVIDRIQSSMSNHLLLAAQQLKEEAALFGVPAEFRAVPHIDSDVGIALHSLYCDLLIVGHPGAPGAPFSWSSIDVLQQTGVPILIVPEASSGRQIARRIAVAWNASRQARRAIADALPLLIAADAVDLLIVDPASKAEWHGEEPGADMAAYLARHGVRVDLHRIASQDKHLADVIVEHARHVNADLIVFGAYSRPRISEAILGGVSRTLLADVPFPLFVSH